MDDQGRNQPSCWETPGLKTLTFEAFLPYALSLSLVASSPESSREVDMVSGACMAVRREVFKRLGGMNAKFFMYYEDADFCLRARRAGYHVYFCHEILAVHRLRKSPDTYSASFFSNLYESKVLFFQKHFSRTYSEIARLIIVSGIVLRIPAYFLAGVLLFNKQLLRLSKYHTLVLRKMLRWM
ncbi:MAG: glycosyltransferase family 2 protein [Ignavibacteria bacterium]|nr:MAG: glycosyltransferase family 2 protein [Ignavibacteria bacterium]